MRYAIIASWMTPRGAEAKTLNCEGPKDRESADRFFKNAPFFTPSFGKWWGMTITLYEINGTDRKAIGTRSAT